MNAISPNVFVRAGAVFANSRDVTAFFEKEHRNVLRDIRNLMDEARHWLRMIGEARMLFGKEAARGL
ncbi:MAG: hypothetical protein VB101_04195 [Rhodospirillaceae bacterium]|nr:hypothetical protein [Rhodospirillaceae bacterium]